jgi:hypothetical protein
MDIIYRTSDRVITQLGTGLAEPTADSGLVLQHLTDEQSASLQAVFAQPNAGVTAGVNFGSFTVVPVPDPVTPPDPRVDALATIVADPAFQQFSTQAQAAFAALVGLPLPAP